MATWITHLRVAELLLNDFDELDTCGFTVGSLAPDSGIPDKNRENFKPAKKITHFLAPIEGNPWRKADLLFYDRYLVQEKGSNNIRFSFITGYFLHLVTDNLWDKWIALPVEKIHHKKFESDKKFIWTVKHDWYGLDFMYLYQNPDCFFYKTFMKCEYKKDYDLDFLLKKGIQNQLKDIRKFYTDPERMNWAENRPGIYLSEHEMNAFVRNASQYLKKIYKITVEKIMNTEGYDTIINLHPPLWEN